MSSGYVRTQENGGNGGKAFADNLTETCQLVQVKIRSGRRIDSIQGVWTTPAGSRVTGESHGTGGGSLQSFTLEPGEYITRIDGRAGSRVDQLKFRTSKGRVHGPYGGSGGTPFTISNVQVGGFFGRSGEELDSIGFFTEGAC
ncbi:jacalin-like lectin [Sorangium sp. So ce295]|uniref:jacalin-like lectin n=1 Tax=Sorangium sp. So ce295 TaxID=3133295 RepID=UPI003F623DA8